MTTLTLERVDPTVREWQSPDGKIDLRYITVHFEGGTKGSVATKPESLDKRLGQLKELIGKPGEYVLDGEKVKDWPGKAPAGGFGGGGGSKWQPKSPEERAEILTMNALNAWAAVNAGVPHGQPIDVVQQAMLAFHRTASKIVQTADIRKVFVVTQEDSESASSGVEAISPSRAEPGSEHHSEVPPSSEQSGEAVSPPASSDSTSDITSADIEDFFGNPVAAAKATAAMFPNHSVHSLTQKQRRELLEATTRALKTRRPGLARNTPVDVDATHAGSR